ncbi:uncharacterized protein V1510DRAFT_416885 [Dipodascopsis tothii]|uniref:uncharacterized protein n=1 Tax=Dipodascopsis tothii TaxID=44089 RepID=UPI0034CD2F21
MSLRVVVPIKRVIDFALKPRVKGGAAAIETAGVKFSLNPFCEIAVEEAVRLREKGVAKTVTTVSAGNGKAADVLRNSLAMGADRAVHIETDTADATSLALEPLAVAKLLKAFVDKEGADVVVLGKQAVDDDSNQVGQMLAGLLGWSQATNASKVEVDGSRVLVTREVDGGEETLAAALPLVVTTDLRLNTPRYARLQDIMKAKKKKIEKTSPAELGVDIAPRLETVSLAEPAARQGGARVPDVAALVAKLKAAGAV